MSESKSRRESKEDSKEVSPSGKKYSSVQCISFAEEMNASHRPTMEDSHVVQDGLGGDKDVGFFGVYDGHGGREMSEFLRMRLHVVVAEELKLRSGRSIPECLTAAFLRADAEARKKKNRDGEPMPSGSTAVTCLVKKSGGSKYLYCANCGDARAVLCKGETAVRLSTDHTAANAHEAQRVKDAGGFVIRNRVLGVLAVSRSFGDFVMKPCVTAEPAVTTTKLTSEAKFVIIACDGLWDAMSDQVAVDLVRGFIGKDAEKKKDVAKFLVKKALERGSMDNVTVLVVFL